MKKPSKPQSSAQPAAPAKTTADVPEKKAGTPVRPAAAGAPSSPAPKAVAAPAKAAPVSKSASAGVGMKPVAPRRLVTSITALIDVGYGNTLYLRGEGPGLSWETGIPLECKDTNKWSLSLGESSRPVVCKFLINDSEWNRGEDYTIAPGTSITITPVF